MQISVIMAVYNGQRFLRECVESVLGQTVTDFEFVIVDDGSSDQTASILAEYAARDSRLVVLRQENRGLPGALNRAIAASRGEFVARMDSDDRMLSIRLERQLQFIREHPEALVVCSFAYLIDVAGKRIGKSQTLVDVERGIAELRPSCFLEIVHPTVMMRRRDIQDLGGYDESLTYAEDRELWGRVVLGGKIIRCQPEFLLDFRLHSGAMSMKKALRNSSLVRGIDLNILLGLRHERRLSSEELDARFRGQPLLKRLDDDRRFLALFHYKNATRHFAERRWLPCVSSLGIAVCLRPFFTLRRIADKFSMA